MKTCSKCGFVGDDELFVKGRIVCLECNKERKKEYYESNKKYVKEKAKEYRENNREKYLISSRKYYESNKYSINKVNSNYRENNREKIAKMKKEYCENNKEKIKEYHREYRENNKEKISERNKKYSKKIIHEIRGSYIRNAINRHMGIKAADIPIELLELKREQLQLHRLIKEAQNGINRTGNQRA
jgi:uncharacterized Zn finger protein (UPF0148 family)